MRRFRRGVLAGWLTLTATGYGLAQNGTAQALTDSIQRYASIANGTEGREDSGNWLKLAATYQAATRYGDAERAYGRAVSLLKAQNSPDLANAMDLTATLYAQEGKLGKAEQTEMGALQLAEQRDDRLSEARCWMTLAMILLGEHHVSEAGRYAGWAVDRLVAERQAQQDQVSIEQQMAALIYLSEAREAEGDSASAVQALNRAREIGGAKYAPSSFPMAYVDFLLGYAHWRNGEDDLAAELMKAGAPGIQAELGWGHPTCVQLMRHYEAFLKQTQRREEAAELRAAMARARAMAGPVNGSGSAMAALSP